MDLRKYPIPEDRGTKPAHRFPSSFAHEEQAEVSRIDTAPKELSAAVIAKRVVDLIQEGKDPKTALTEVGLPPNALEKPDMKQRIQALLARAYLPAEFQRAALRAGRMDIFMDMMEKGLKIGDTGMLKIALEASKQIGMDPEVGLNQPPQQIVNVDLAPLRDLLSKTEPLEGFEAPVIDLEESSDGSYGQLARDGDKNGV